PRPRSPHCDGSRHRPDQGCRDRLLVAPATSSSPPSCPWLPCLPSCPLSRRQQAPHRLSRQLCRRLSRQPSPQPSRRLSHRPSRLLLRLPRSLLPLSPCRSARVLPPFPQPASWPATPPVWPPISGRHGLPAPCRGRPGS